MSQKRETEENCLKIGDKSKVLIKWEYNPNEYSDEAIENLKISVAKKYNIDSSNVSIEPIFVGKKENEELSVENGAIEHIQEPEYQQKLFLEYFKENGIEDYDYDKIIEIDNLINNSINYDKYEKYKRYELKWIKWSNFMSYGPNNFFDFRDLKGLVLLTSEPANQGGKTTFCLDLFRFLLFGKVTSRENNWTLQRVFNDHIPEATEVEIEGCIRLDGNDYVIKRTITRPTLKKRTEKSKVSQKVQYYRIVNDEYVELDDVEDVSEGSVRETNKVIKEAIGNERDFDLMILVSSDNLKELISLKDTDRGRLIARWVGLLPLEEKDKIARDTYNHSIQNNFLSNRYSKTSIENELDVLKKENEEYINSANGLKKNLDKEEKALSELTNKKEKLLSSKVSIDDSLVKVDVETLETQLDNVINLGKIKRNEKTEAEKRYKEIKDVTFDEANYKALEDNLKAWNNELAISREQVKHIKVEIEALKKGEFCPTCGAKLTNVDNSKKIEEKNNEFNLLVKNGTELAKKVKDGETNKENLSKDRNVYQEKLRLELKIDKLDVDIENLTNRYKEFKNTLKNIEDNKIAIETNNKIDASINVINVSIKEAQKLVDTIKEEIANYRAFYRSNDKSIKEYEKLIIALTEEEKDIRSWKQYLELVGKNGISKMVLRSVLPIINAELRRLLEGVCDFYIEIVIDERNDVAFNMIHDGIKKNLGGGSGFEQTVSSLALRSVLSKISTFSKPNFVIFDEILGGVSDENYDNVKKLYDKIVNDNKIIFQITHLKALTDWHNTIVTVTKKDNISSIAIS